MLDAHWARVALVSVLLPGSAAWAATVGAKQRPGLNRTLYMIPALACMVLSPFLFNVYEPLALIGTAYLSERLPLTKLLAFCLGRGVLAGPQKYSLSQFVALTLCPLALMPDHSHGTGAGGKRSRQHLTPATYQRAFTTSAIKFMILGFFIAKPRAPVSLISGAFQQLFLVAGMYCAMSGLLDLTLLSCLHLGLDLAMPFNHPYLATSLADFWGTRWNVPQSQLLKALVYDPIMDGQLVKPAHDSVWQGREHGRGMANQQQKSQGHDLPSDTVHQLNRPRHPDRTEEASAHKEGDFIMRGAGAGLQGRKERSAGLAAKKFVSSSLWACMLQKRRDAARVVALLATFMFSGLEHVLFLWYVTRSFYWSWMVFFAVHGLLVAIELLLSRRSHRQPAISNVPPQMPHQSPPNSALYRQQQQRQQRQQQMEQNESQWMQAMAIIRKKLPCYAPRSVPGTASVVQLLVRVCRVLVTLAVLHVTGSLWFYEPLQDLIEQVLASCRQSYA